MTIKVIGAGFGRTGTLSLKTALEELGFGPCYHMTELFDKPEHVAFWDGAADKVTRGEPVDWEEVFSDYEATVDWPGCSFYEELIEAYPDAKVLLSVRDPQRWYESAQSTIAQGPGSAASPLRSLLFRSAGLLVPSMRRVPSMAQKVIMERSFGGRFGDRGHAVEAFERHNREVQERVPAGKLLVYEVKQGWKPLCELLGVEEPDKPFPHLNDREEFPRMMRRRMMSAVAPALGKAVVTVSALLFAVWVLRRTPRVPCPR
jgi:hypothetical protein